MTSQTLRFIVDQEGKMETQKIKYLENEESFLDEIKNIFHSF